MPAIRIHTELARLLGCRAEWDAAEVGRLIADRYEFGAPTTSAAAEAIGFVGRNVGKCIGGRHIDIEQHAVASVADVLNFGKAAAQAVGFGIVTAEDLARYIDAHADVHGFHEELAILDLPRPWWAAKVEAELKMIADRMFLDLVKRGHLPEARRPANPDAGQRPS